jgi:transposase
VGSASVIGDERSWWACGEDVDEHSEGEREQALGDALGEAADRLGEVALEPHLALEIGEDRARLGLTETSRPGRSVLEEVEDPLMSRPRKYPPELLDRGARLVFESERPVAHVARALGVPSERLRKYVRQVEADEGRRPDLPTSEEREEIKRLRKEVYELRRANEILKAASVFFATELDADRPK